MKECILNLIYNWKNLNGRVGRKGYALWWLLIIFIQFVIQLIVYNISNGNWNYSIYIFLIFIYLSFPIIVKRLHDINKSTKLGVLMIIFITLGIFSLTPVIMFLLFAIFLPLLFIFLLLGAIGLLGIFILLFVPSNLDALNKYGNRSFC